MPTSFIRKSDNAVDFSALCRQKFDRIAFVEIHVSVFWSFFNLLIGQLFVVLASHLIVQDFEIIQQI